MIRVLLCDDHERAQQAVQHMSEASTDDGGPEISVVRQTSTVRATVHHLFAARVDVVLLDLFLPVTDSRDPAPATGAWLARAIAGAFRKEKRPCPPLVLWTSNVESTLQVRNECRAFRHHGGTQVMDKQSSVRDQVRTLQAALAGEVWEPPDDGLTPVEREVLAYYAAGHPEADIAGRLFKSPRTIEGTAKRLRAKLIPGAAGDAARGAAPVVAAASQPGSRVSWLPVEHLGEPPEHLSLLREFDAPDG